MSIQTLTTKDGEYMIILSYDDANNYCRVVECKTNKTIFDYKTYILIDDLASELKKLVEYLWGRIPTGDGK